MSRRCLMIFVSLCLAGCVEEEVATPGTAVASMDAIYQGPPELSAAAPRSPRRAVQTPAPPVAQDPHVIRTCEAADGALSYQDMPCADGSTELARRVVEPEAPGAARRAAESQAAALNDARRVAEIAYGSRVQRSGSRQVASNGSEAVCEAARVQAKKTRDQYWNRMTYNWSQQLDAWVHAACAGTNEITRWNTMPMGPMRSSG